MVSSLEVLPTLRNMSLEKQKDTLKKARLDPELLQQIFLSESIPKELEHEIDVTVGGGCICNSRCVFKPIAVAALSDTKQITIKPIADKVVSLAPKIFQMPQESPALIVKKYCDLTSKSDQIVMTCSQNSNSQNLETATEA